MPRMGVLESGFHVGGWRMNNGYGSTIRGTTYQFINSHDLSQSTPESRSVSGKHSETQCRVHILPKRSTEASRKVQLEDIGGEHGAFLFGGDGRNPGYVEAWYQST